MRVVPASATAHSDSSGRLVFHRRLRVGLDAGHHRCDAVRALRRQMFPETKLVEKGARIGGQNLRCRPAGEQAEDDGNEALHDQGVAVAGKTEAWLMAILFLM